MQCYLPKKEDNSERHSSNFMKWIISFFILMWFNYMEKCGHPTDQKQSNEDFFVAILREK